MALWDVSTDEAVASLIRSAEEDTGLDEGANVACAVCQARTTPQWRFVERQRVCNRCFMKLRKGSWNRHASTVLEEYCSAMGYDPSNAIRIGKFFACPEDDPPVAPGEEEDTDPTKICVMLIEEDVVSLPGLSWSKANNAWRSSYLDTDTGEIKFQLFPVDKSQNLTEEMQRIRVFDFKMRNVEEAKAWRKQFGYPAKIHVARSAQSPVLPRPPAQQQQQQQQQQQAAPVQQAQQGSVNLPPSLTGMLQGLEGQNAAAMSGALTVQGVEEERPAKLPKLDL